MEHLALGLAAILGLGISAQWIAWRFRIPSILLLLIFGFVAGPVAELLHPDELFGELLMPLVSLSVGVILFEGGLTLKLVELPHIGSVVRNLNSISVLVTWGLTTVAGYFILGLSGPLAILLGAILVVTGPTVIGPLLRHVGNVGPAGAILKWEGILIDPIGATLALLVFEALLAGADAGVPRVELADAIIGFGRTALVGGVIGMVGAALVAFPLKRYWIPDYLQNPITLMVVIAAFALSNEIQHESGLLATTVMGIALSNAKVDVKHILEFKENLTVLLISSLFIILSARLDLGFLSEANLPMLGFLLILLFVVRPLSVAVSTAGSDLAWQERLFIAWLAPRGIVAAAVASIFAFELVEVGYTEAERLVPIVFLVIVGTVAVYGLTAVPLARWLGLDQMRPRGLLVAGAHDWARELASRLQEYNHRVVLVDNNRDHIATANLMGLETLYGNILSEQTEDRVELEGLGRFLALTSNDEINSLAALNYADLFGREEVYQLSPHRAGEAEGKGEATVPRPLRGKTLFGRHATAEHIAARYNEGAVIKATQLSEQFTYQDYRASYPDAVVLFVVGLDNALFIVTDQELLVPIAGQTLISLVDPVDEAPTNVEKGNAPAPVSLHQPER